MASGRKIVGRLSPSEIHEFVSGGSSEHARRKAVVHHVVGQNGELPQKVLALVCGGAPSEEHLMDALKAVRTGKGETLDEVTIRKIVSALKART